MGTFLPTGRAPLLPQKLSNLISIVNSPAQPTLPMGDARLRRDTTVTWCMSKPPHRPFASCALIYWGAWKRGRQSQPESALSPQRLLTPHSLQGLLEASCGPAELVPRTSSTLGLWWTHFNNENGPPGSGLGGLTRLSELLRGEGPNEPAFFLSLLITTCREPYPTGISLPFGGQPSEKQAKSMSPRESAIGCAVLHHL